MTNNDRASGYTDEEAGALYEEFVSSPARPEKMGDAIWERMQSEDYSEWLVPGVLSTELTQIYGKRESGKSTFIREIIAPLSKGEPVFGIAPATGDRPLNILVLGTDPGAEEEYVSKLRELGYDGDRVGVEYIGNGEIPEYVYAKAKHGALDLVVIDNLGGIVPGKELNDSATAGLAFLKYEPFISVGVPVVIVAHQGKSGGDSSTGSHQHEAKPRFRLQVGQNKDKTRLTVKGAGNLGESSFEFRIGEGFRLSLVSSDVPTGSEGQSRSSETLNKNQRIAEFAAQAPDQSSNNKIGVFVYRQDPSLGGSGRSLGTTIGRLINQKNPLLKESGTGKERKVSKM